MKDLTSFLGNQIRNRRPEDSTDSLYGSLYGNSMLFESMGDLPTTMADDFRALTTLFNDPKKFKTTYEKLLGKVDTALPEQLKAEQIENILNSHQLAEFKPADMYGAYIQDRASGKHIQNQLLNYREFFILLKKHIQRSIELLKEKLAKLNSIKGYRVPTLKIKETEREITRLTNLFQHPQFRLGIDIHDKNIYKGELDRPVTPMVQNTPINTATNAPSLPLGRSQLFNHSMSYLPTLPQRPTPADTATTSTSFTRRDGLPRNPDEQKACDLFEGMSLNQAIILDSAQMDLYEKVVSREKSKVKPKG